MIKIHGVTSFKKIIINNFDQLYVEFDQTIELTIILRFLLFQIMIIINSI